MAPLLVMVSRVFGDRSNKRLSAREDYLIQSNSAQEELKMDALRRPAAPPDRRGIDKSRLR
jgi:hypothetical protein